MPVEICISCAFPEPGWQSRLMKTSICVSFVFRSSFAVRAAILHSLAGQLGSVYRLYGVRCDISAACVTTAAVFLVTLFGTSRSQPIGDGEILIRHRPSHRGAVIVRLLPPLV